MGDEGISWKTMCNQFTHDVLPLLCAQIKWVFRLYTVQTAYDCTILTVLFVVNVNKSDSVLVGLRFWSPSCKKVPESRAACWELGRGHFTGIEAALMPVKQH